MTGSPTPLVERLDAAGVRAVSFDCFGTLLTVEEPPDPSQAVADALEARGIDIPEEWGTAYRTAYIETDQPLQELPLADHVYALLEAHSDRDRSPDVEAVTDAVRGAFETSIQTRTGAVETVSAFSEAVPVAILSNSSVNGLVDRAVAKSDLSADVFDVVRASVDLGWRKPHERTFRAIADELDVDVSSLVHVGDDPRTDGGADRAGARAVIVPDSGPLTVETITEADGWPR